MKISSELSCLKKHAVFNSGKRLIEFNLIERYQKYKQKNEIF